MNFYKRYPGDYARDTGHLSLTEHGAYTLLLDRYYSTGDLPSDLNEIYILCRAISKQDRQAVHKVLNQFFPDGKNHRADVEIEAWQTQAEHNRANAHYGRLGGRPKKPRVGSDENPERVSEITQGGGQTKPLSRSQIPEEESKSGVAASPADPRKQLFELGRTILGADSGSLISRAIKQTDETTVGAILGEMAVKTKADPRAYFIAATKPKERGLVA
jgi:uncharacterized protein YdaU (DUF1376 family)